MSETSSASEEKTVTILHLSDIQFGVNHYFGRLGFGAMDKSFDTLLRRVTDDLDGLCRVGVPKPDIVALTGDLAEWGKKKEYDDVLGFCRGLASHLGHGIERVLVVPGNHDINRDYCASYFSRCAGDGETPKEPWWPKWEPFAQFFDSLYGGKYSFTQEQPWTLYELPDLHVVVAGLNSTMRESHKEKEAPDPKKPDAPESIFGHYGWLGEGQLAWFRGQLEAYAAKEWLRVGLVHHNAIRGPVGDDHNLRDVDLFRDRLGELINLLLHGHTHHGRLEWLEETLPVISTGSASVVAKERPEEIPNQYQFIEVHRHGLRRWGRQYVPHERKWIGDNRISQKGDTWKDDRRCIHPQSNATFGGRERRASRPGPREDADDSGDPYKRDRLDHVRDDLLAQVIEICKVRDERGRVEVTRISNPGPWGDYARVADPTRGVYVLGAHEGPATIELIDRWAGDVHDPFRRRGNRGKASDLVVASQELLEAHVVARAAERGITLVRRTEYERIIDTERVKELLWARLDGDPEYAHELYIEQRVRLWSPVEDRTEVAHPAADRVASMLCEPEGCFVLVLGAAGTGKTFLLREVARAMMERQSLVTPIVVELRGLDRAQDVVELAAFEFARRRLSLPVRAFERDLRDGRIALLFDGFDELAIRVRPAAIHEHFERIAAAARDRARVLVASRSEHFVTQKAAVEALMRRVSPDVAGLARQLQAITQRRLVVTQKFSPDDIAEYLGRVLGSPEAGLRRMERFKKVYDLPGLAATPRMLSFLVQLTDEQLDEAAARRDAITSAELYRLVIVDHWLGQQERQLNPPGGAPGPTRAVLLDAATRLALHLWRSTAKRVLASELDVHASEQLRKLCDGDGEVARQMVQCRTLLTHADDDSFEFVHQTVMEWLVAQSIAEEIGRSGRCAELEVGRLSEFMMDVLRELVGEAGLAAWAKRALGETPGSRGAENARLVLAFLKQEVVEVGADLRGQDLRGQSLEGQSLRGTLLDGADLRGVDLSSRDLRGASLRGARLCHANLRGADLHDARLEDADLSFATLDRAILDGVEFKRTNLMATRGLATRGAFDSTTARHADAAAWSADLAVISILGGIAGCLAVAWSPDGLLLATTHTDGSFRVWDVTRGLLLRVIVGHTDWVRSVAWSPNGNWLASGSDDNSVRVWEAASGKGLQVMIGHADWVRSVAWSPDGTRLASGSDDKSVRVWEAVSGKLLWAMSEHTNGVRSVAWSPDGRRLASGSDDKSVRVWEAIRGKAQRGMMWRMSGVLSVAWSPDGTRLAMGSSDSTLLVFGATNGKILRSMEGHKNGVTSVAWSSDGKWLASGSADNSVRVWEAASGRALRTIEGHTNGVTSVAWSPDGTLLVSGSDDKSVCVWEAASGKALRTMKGHPNWVRCVAWSPDGTRFVSGSDDNRVRVWEVASGRTLQAMDHPKGIRSVAWSPDGTRLASGTDDKSVRVWEPSGIVLRAMRGHTNGVRSVAWSPDGTRLASGSDDRSIHVWEVASGKAARVMEGHRSGVMSVAWSPDGLRIASGSSDNSVRVWEAASGKALRGMVGHTNGVMSVAWSPDGTQLASGSDDKSMRVWEAASGRALRVMRWHTSGILSVAWSPDGTQLASGSYDNSVRVWEAASGKAIVTLLGHVGAVWSVSWRRDGRHLISAGNDGTLRVWDVVTGECLAIHVLTPSGAAVIRPSDGRYRIQGGVDGQVWHTIGLARYELGELDEFVEGGLRLADDELLIPPVYDAL